MRLPRRRLILSSQSSPVLKVLLAMYTFHELSGSHPSVFCPVQPANNRQTTTNKNRSISTIETNWLAKPVVKMSLPVTRTLFEKVGWTVQ